MSGICFKGHGGEMGVASHQLQATSRISRRRRAWKYKRTREDGNQKAAARARERVGNKWSL
jgi:hypothetical protein